MSDLPDLSKLDPKTAYFVKGKTLSALFKRQDSLWAGENVERGPGIYIRRAGRGAGYVISSKAGGTDGGDGIDEVAFGVAITGDVTHGFKATVNALGSLLINMVLNNRQAITGLESPFVFNLGNDLIWLEITFDSGGGIAAAAINSYGLGGAWIPSDVPQEYGNKSGMFEFQTLYDDAGNPYYQQYVARIAIFSSATSTVAPFPVVNTQMLDTNLIMTGDLYFGNVNSSAGTVLAAIGVQMPKPFAAPYIIPGL